MHNRYLSNPNSDTPIIFQSYFITGLLIFTTPMLIMLGFMCWGICFAFEYIFERFFGYPELGLYVGIIGILVYLFFTVRNTEKRSKKNNTCKHGIYRADYYDETGTWRCPECQKEFYSLHPGAKADPSKFLSPSTESKLRNKEATEWIFGIFNYVAIASFVLSYIYPEPTKPYHSVITAFIYCEIAVVILGIIEYIYYRCKEYAEKQKSLLCPHGIRYGTKQNAHGEYNCPACALQIQKEQAEHAAQEAARRAEIEKHRALDLQYRAAIQRAQHERNNHISIVDEQLDLMTAYEFEDFVAALLEKIGYTSVIQTQRSNDGGKDVICEKNGVKYYVECKHYKVTSKIGRPLIQKLGGAMYADRIDHGIFITTSFFSQEALDAARESNIQTIDRNRLASIIATIDYKSSTYDIPCPLCGSIVTFHYWAEVKVKSCPLGHQVEGASFTSKIKTTDMIRY